MLRAVLSAWSSILEHFRHPKGNSMPISTSSSLILSPAPLRTFWHLPDSAAAAKPLQSCPTLCDPIDGSPPGSPVLGIFQARTLEWVAISFSNAWKWKVKWSRSVVSNPQRPHGLQPTRLLCPWDFPGKRTGVGCHCLLRPDSEELPILDTSFWSGFFHLAFCYQGCLPFNGGTLFWYGDRPHCVHLFSSWRTWGLFPLFSYCEQCCCEHLCTRLFQIFIFEKI